MVKATPTPSNSPYLLAFLTKVSFVLFIPSFFRFFLIPSLFFLVFLASIYIEPLLEVEKLFPGHLVHFESCLVVQGRVL
jgi:hypothetical protein